jgi:protein SCO1
MNQIFIDRVMRCLAGAAVASLCVLRPVGAADEHAHHHHEGMAGAAMDHSQHKANVDVPVKRSVVEVQLPSVKLVRQDGANVNFDQEVGGNSPVILAFIYTTCTTVCPVTSQILAQTQALLGKDMGKTRMVSVSIDPEYDTPARLLAYSKKFGASPQWQHYTGTLTGSVAVQKAFGAYRGDKMNHEPLFFLRAAGKKSWVKLQGFPSAERMVQEYRELNKG